MLVRSSSSVNSHKKNRRVKLTGLVMDILRYEVGPFVVGYLIVVLMVYYSRLWRVITCPRDHLILITSLTSSSNSLGVKDPCLSQ